MEFTDKQEDFLLDVIDGKLERINILTGSVRSGKTFISLVAWLCWLIEQPTSDNYIMIGKTLTSLKRNCMQLLESFCGEGCFSVSYSRKEAEIYGRKVFLEGVNDSRAENKIRGMTLHGAYCDEITLYTDDFFNMLLSRLTSDGAKLIGTTNPDSPNHWLKTNFLDRQDELSLKLWNFLLDDNTSLSEETRGNIKREFTGVYYDRFVLSKWVTANGLIYRNFVDNKDNFVVEDTNDRYMIITIGIDYGASKSKTTFIATGISRQYLNVSVIMEKSISGVHTPDTIYFAFYEFYCNVRDKYGYPNFAFCDYGALGQILTAGLKAYCISKGLPIKIVDCTKGTINDRIQLVCRLFGQDRIRINKTCIGLIDALSNAIWDDKKVDTRLDDGTVGIDFLDAFEYSIYYYASPIMHAKKTTPDNFNGVII